MQTFQLKFELGSPIRILSNSSPRLDVHKKQNFVIGSYIKLRFLSINTNAHILANFKKYNKISNRIQIFYMLKQSSGVAFPKLYKRLYNHNL